MKTESYLLRMTKRERKQIEDNAKKVGLSIASFLRLAGMKGIKVEAEPEERKMNRLQN